MLLNRKMDQIYIERVSCNVRKIFKVIKVDPKIYKKKFHIKNGPIFDRKVGHLGFVNL